MEAVDETGTLEAVGREVDHVEDDGEGGVERPLQTAERLDAALLAVVVHHHVEDVGERHEDDDEDDHEVQHVVQHRLDDDGEVADGRQQLDEVQQRPRQQETGGDATQLAHQRDLRGRKEPGGRAEHGHRDKDQLAHAVEVVVKRRLATTDYTLATPAPPAAIMQEEVRRLSDVNQ